MIQTNVLGVYFGMKAQIRQMLKNGGGSIVNLASIAGLNGIPYTGAYCASKHAVVGLTKAGALDYATDGIRINAVAPGAAKTEIIIKAMTQGVYDEATIAAMHPMNRMGKLIGNRPTDCGRLLPPERGLLPDGHILGVSAVPTQAFGRGVV